MCLLAVCLLTGFGGMARADEPLPDDYRAFMTGFTAYQQREYGRALQQLNAVLTEYPDTPLRDVTLFWLSCACYRNGNSNLAARYLAQLSREYPDTELRGMAEEGLNRLAIRYEQGEKLPVANLGSDKGAS